ncbi:MAG: hypothetical protein ACRDJP_01620 [Actinomycetota bacterium]
MTIRVLNIVATAYRGTLEEQDDTVLWLTSMCGAAGLDVAVLLEGNAVNYAARGQDSSGLRFGAATLAHPPSLDHDIETMLAKGLPVTYVADDAERLGLDEGALVGGVKPVALADLPSLFDGFDLIWRW